MYQPNKKIVAASCVLAIALVATPPAAIAEQESKVYTQLLSIPTSKNLLDSTHKFQRLNAKIITTKPWLKPEHKNFRFSDSEIRNILIEAGFSGNGLKTAMRIVRLESTNRPYALNSSTNCYGLFQINMTEPMGKDRRIKYGLSKNEDLFDPLINAKIAFHMSNRGRNWSAWTTY